MCMCVHEAGREEQGETLSAVVVKKKVISSFFFSNSNFHTDADINLRLVTELQRKGKKTPACPDSSTYIVPSAPVALCLDFPLCFFLSCLVDFRWGLGISDKQDSIKNKVSAAPG